MFAETELDLLQKIIQQGLLGALGETLLMTFVPTILAFVVGLPLGILLVTGEEKGIRPISRPLLAALNADGSTDPEQVLARVRGAVDGFVTDAEQFDDLTMLCMTYHGPQGREA